jgi:hypothetical protein
MKFLIAILIPALLVTSIGLAQSRQTADQPNISAEEHAIYAAVIDKIFAGDKVSLDSTVRMLVIVDQTMSTPSALGVRKRLKRAFSPAISQETIENYVVKNAKSYQLTTSLDLKLKYTLVPKEKTDQIFKSGVNGWDEFYRQFPNSRGIISLSRAGFDSSGKQAIVYVAHSCGGLCGAGYYLSLVKKGNEWIVQKSFVAWVS